jgi:perosamine synthetase
MNKIRLFSPDLNSNDLNGVKRVFKKRWLGQGSEVIKLENEFKNFIGSKFALAVNSGSAALQLALSSFNFKKGKKVFVNNLTFVSSANCILLNHLKPVLIDVDPNTLGFDLNDAKKKIDKDVVAIIVVHYGGHPAEMDKIMKFAKHRNIKVIEDCAHCLGGIYKKKKLGTWGDIGCFSFEEKKIITSGDGGMIVTNNKKFLKKIKSMRWCGIEKNTWSREKNFFKNKKSNYDWHYEVSYLGYKYNMNDLSACIARSQLRRINKIIYKRNRLLKYYVKKINKIKIKPLLPYNVNIDNVYWLIGIRHKDRNALIKYLNIHNISTGVHYLPLSKQPLYKKYDKKLIVSNKVWNEILTLPFHTNLKFKEIDIIIKYLEKFGINKNINDNFIFN